MDKIKVIVDQDARGPGTSDMQAILVFLQSNAFEVLGITTVSGDQWGREETQHVLLVVEIAERTDVPVCQGAEYPLLNSKEESERWEALYGKLEYKGCWTEHFPAGRSTIFAQFYHPPEIVPPLLDGAPQLQPRNRGAVHRGYRPQISGPGRAVVRRAAYQFRARPVPGPGGRDPRQGA